MVLLNEMESKFRSKWKGRNLDNYKSQHTKTAHRKDVWNEFIAAKTLTQARKILFGNIKK